MGLDERQEQHDARLVEASTIAALLLGVLAGVALLVVACLVGRFALPPRELREPLIT